LLAARRPRYDASAEARDLFRSFESPSPSRNSSLRRSSLMNNSGSSVDGSDSATPDQAKRRASLRRRSLVSSTSSLSTFRSPVPNSGRSALKSLDEEVAATSIHTTPRQGRRRRASIASGIDDGVGGTNGDGGDTGDNKELSDGSDAQAKSTPSASHRRYSSVITTSTVNHSAVRRAVLAAHTRQMSQPPVVMKMPSVVFPPPTNVITSPTMASKTINNATSLASSNTASTMTSPPSPSKPKSFKLTSSSLTSSNIAAALLAATSAPSSMRIASTDGSISVSKVNALVASPPTPQASPPPLPSPLTEINGSPDTSVVSSPQSTTSSTNNNPIPTSASTATTPLITATTTATAAAMATLGNSPPSSLPPSISSPPSTLLSSRFHRARSILAANGAAIANSLLSPSTTNRGHRHRPTITNNDIATNLTSNSNYNFGGSPTGDVSLTSDQESADNDTNDNDSLPDTPTTPATATKSLDDPDAIAAADEEMDAITSGSTTTSTSTAAPSPTGMGVGGESMTSPSSPRRSQIGVETSVGRRQGAASVVNIGSSSFGGMRGPSQRTLLEYQPVMTQAAAALPGTPSSAAWRVSNLRVSTLRPSPPSVPSPSSTT
jgi:hypothetical protein